jgi:hypothetical protein
MRILQFFVTAVLVLVNSVAGAACEIKAGFTNQNMPPYHLGEGSVEPNPPGATVELIREAAANVGCTLTTIRLPPLRLAAALDAGTIDIAPLNALAGAGL